MKTITIAPDDTNNHNEFVAGNPVQVRVKVKEAEVAAFKKGTTVEVVHEQKSDKGKIVSEPLVVSPSAEKGEKVLSLIIEKID